MGLPDSHLGPAFIDGGVRHRFFGRVLRPFSVWHLFLLQAIDSPFTTKGDVFQFHLETAVGVCRLRYPDSKIQRPWVGPLSSWRLARKGGLEREVARFLDYAGDYLSKPEYAIHPRPRPEGAPPPPQRTSAPFILRLVADIVGWAHCPIGDAWNLPVGQAHWWQSMAHRAHGEDVDFMDEEEREFQAQMEAAGMKPIGG